MARTRLLLVALCLMWALAVAAGMAWMLDFSARPGDPGSPPASWPAHAILERGARYTLVMAAHPRCPCTRASLDELAEVMADGKDRLTAYVLFFAPEGTPSDWWTTDLWQKAAAMPAVRPVVDRGGTLQRVFGAETSGSVAVYDAAGRLQFSGGITAARGHRGVNAGRLSLISLIESGEAAAMTPVFGCPLRTPAATDAQLR